MASSPKKGKTIGVGLLNRFYHGNVVDVSGLFVFHSIIQILVYSISQNADVPSHTLTLTYSSQTRIANFHRAHTSQNLLLESRNDCYMQYNLFIGYSGEDKKHAEFVYNCLSQIAEMKPYLAEILPNYGESFKERILNFLDITDFMVVFLTKNGVESQWVNQEIGYATAIKRKKHPMRIIPISLKNVQLKG